MLLSSQGPPRGLFAELSLIESTVAGFAQSITSAVGNFGQVNTNDLCVGSTCVTPAQFEAMAAAANQSGDSSTPPSANDATDTPPVMQINGDNPAIIQVGATYTDLGAQITGPQADLNLGIITYVNGAPMNPIQLDTTQAATDTIQYVVTGQSGRTATSTRTVIVAAPDSAESPTGSTTTIIIEAPSIVPTEEASTTTATSSAE